MINLTSPENIIDHHMRMLDIEGHNLVINYFVQNFTIDNKYKSANDLSLLNFITHKKNLSNRYYNIKNIQTVLNNDLEKSNLKDFKETLNELNYEFKSVIKDKETIELEKKKIEEELLKLKGPESYRSNIKICTPNYKTARNFQDFKSISDFSTQMSILEFKKDLDSKKKNIKFLDDHVANFETLIHNTKIELKDKSLINHQIFTENTELSYKINQKYLIIKQLRLEISMIKDKKSKTQIDQTIQFDNKELSIDKSSILLKETQDIKINSNNLIQEIDKNKGFLGYVKSIFGKK